MTQLPTSGPLPDDYQFSTLWGVYINLSTKHIEVCTLVHTQCIGGSYVIAGIDA